MESHEFPIKSGKITRFSKSDKYKVNKIFLFLKVGFGIGVRKMPFLWLKLLWKRFLINTHSGSTYHQQLSLSFFFFEKMYDI